MGIRPQIVFCPSATRVISVCHVARLDDKLEDTPHLCSREIRLHFSTAPSPVG